MLFSCQMPEEELVLERQPALAEAYISSVYRRVLGLDFVLDIYSIFGKFSRSQIRQIRENLPCTFFKQKSTPANLVTRV